MSQQAVLAVKEYGSDTCFRNHRMARVKRCLVGKVAGYGRPVSPRIARHEYSGIVGDEGGHPIIGVEGNSRDSAGPGRLRCSGGQGPTPPGWPEELNGPTRHKHSRGYD